MVTHAFSAKNRMLFRDLLHMRGQVIAVTIVVACGISSFVSMRSVYRSLLLAQETYYRDYRLADIFANVKRAPESLQARVAAIPGVAQVETRVVMDVTAEVPGLEEPATLRLLSLPDQRRLTLNDRYLRKGQYPQPRSSRDILLSEAFATANQLPVGARFGAILNGRWQTLHVTGIALSPEYVYEVRGSGSFLPDNRRFGVAWMSRDALEAAFDLEGAWNDISVTLTRGANADEVITRLDTLLAPYGGLGAYGREEQISARFLSDEIAQNRVSSHVVPAVFLAVAAFLLHMVLSRLLQLQRPQIGLLKAFGYSNRDVGWHYTKMALAMITPGVTGGALLGIVFGSSLVGLYLDFYRFPELPFLLGTGILLQAAAISVAAAVLGALSATLRAVRLPPAEAMRPESPPSYHAGLLERLRLARLLHFAVRMIVRGMGRRRVKTLLSTTGIAAAAGIVVVGMFFYDSFRYMMDVQFRILQRDNVSVVFHQPRPPDAYQSIRRLPGVLHSEPFRDLPARIRYGHRSKRVGIHGIAANSELRPLRDAALDPVNLPPDGLLISRKLSELLHVEPPQQVTVEILEGERPIRIVPVAAIVDDMLGVSAYMDIHAVNRLMREGDVVNGAHLLVDTRLRPALYQQLKRTPAVSAVTIREATLESFEEIIAGSFLLSANILLVSACAIAFGVVYNGARIALSERATELASLRVLGFTEGEVGRILLGEQGLITMAGIPLGCLWGYGLAAFLVQRLSTELYRMPLVISSRTYAFAIVVVLTAAVLSGLLVARRVRHLDLLAVLKSRE